MKKILMLFGVIVLTTVLAGCTWFDDAAKDHKSDTSGLERKVTIYSKDGKVLHQYEGKKIRTKYSDEAGGSYIVINVDGKRLQVLNADVVIEEKGIEKFETK
ncbi:hypothetical protein CPT_Machias_035 [Staphylococcus phage Machias]|nr:hypothetical protein CPT_Machias_035 [Staphylococcus phage Machias]